MKRLLSPSAILLFAAGCALRGSAGPGLGAHEFAQAISTGDSTGTCFMSYRIESPGDDRTRNYVHVAWTCRLDLPGTTYPCFVGGNLEFDLSGPDGVVGTGHTRTGGMKYGEAYTFSGTMVLPAREVRSELQPNWRLTCHGEPMRFVTCGPLRRIDRYHVAPGGSSQ